MSGLQTVSQHTRNAFAQRHGVTLERAGELLARLGNLRMIAVPRGFPFNPDDVAPPRGVEIVGDGIDPDEADGKSRDILSRW
jgi:hypothetical protein